MIVVLRWNVITSISLGIERNEQGTKSDIEGIASTRKVIVERRWSHAEAFGDLGNGDVRVA